MAKKKGLGKGLGAIIATSPTPVEALEETIGEESSRVTEIPVSSIYSNPDQPRQHFDEDQIEGLAASIRSVGLIQPVIVRRGGEGYLLVAGERRLRAVKKNMQSVIPAIVIEADEERNVSLALIENIQRTDLDPMEEARAYRLLVDRFNLKQQEISDRVGKDRATVANLLRLLNLPDEVQEGISSGAISTGHAKVLLSLSSKAKQLQAFRVCVEKDLSVRALEEMVRDERKDASSSGGKEQKKKEAHIRKMEEKLIARLGTKVEIRHSGTRGKIEISYYSLDDFDRIASLLGE